MSIKSFSLIEVMISVVLLAFMATLVLNTSNLNEFSAQKKSKLSSYDISCIVPNTLTSNTDVALYDALLKYNLSNELRADAKERKYLYELEDVYSESIMEGMRIVVKKEQISSVKNGISSIYRIYLNP